MSTTQTNPENQATPVERTRVRPRTDVFETPEALIVVADMPGATRDTLEITLTEDVLRLRARSVVTPPADWRPAGAEFELPDYERSFRVAADIDRDGLTATIQNGRVEVVLKKRQPRSQRIEIQGT
jgi:HSP20 family molecular chaperone IbpA